MKLATARCPAAPAGRSLFRQPRAALQAPPRGVARFGAVALIGLIGLACTNPEVSTRGAGPATTREPSVGGSPGGSPGSPGNSPQPGNEPGVPGPGSPMTPIALPDASPVDVPPVPAEPQTCGETSRTAMRVPLDVFVLLDASGSMSSRAGTVTKYEAVKAAILAFLKDTKSEGLGVALNFFPPVVTCEKDADCPMFAIYPGRCLGVDRGCVAPNATTYTRICTAEMPNVCPAPSVCTKVGRCAELAIGNTSCVVGKPCPNGSACNPVVRTCATAFAADCTGARYTKPVVPFNGMTLPASLPDLTKALEQREPSGGTPLGEALVGTLPQLKAYVAANPGRQLVLVVVSDGLPDNSCGGIPGVLAGIEMARMATPPLLTYAIGVFGGVDLVGGRMLMTDIARAGGTNTPFVIDPNASLTEGFLKALDEIRGAALPCEFAIPTDMTASIDYGKVNLRWIKTAGEESIGYVGSADKCDAIKGGWHYDVDPASGKPTRVVVCPATCKAIKGDAAGKIELRFGCKTRGVD